MSFTLTDLTNDYRLERIFSHTKRNCALQLWVLQIDDRVQIENRIIYGRLLPYSFSNNKWFFSDQDNSNSYEGVKTSVTKINLYVDSTICRRLVEKLCAGNTIGEISQELQLELPPRLNSKFGSAALQTENLIYRPVTYLLNRYSFQDRSLTSPHGNSGALSASIIQSNKVDLVSLKSNFNIDLTALIVEQLNSDTGMDFGKVDTVRLGDIELLVFPALDDNEKDLLDSDWNRQEGELAIRFNPNQLPGFESFHFRLNITNSQQIIYSCLGKAKKDKQGFFEHRFIIDKKIEAVADSAELEIFGYENSSCLEGKLCCNWRINFVRELNLTTNFVSNNSTSVKFDWLERTTKSSMLARVKAALSFNSGEKNSGSVITKRTVDSWVTENREISNLFKTIYPPCSDGKFFLRWGPSDGEGRLQFVEWFKKLIQDHSNHHITIFDPYFEDVGLSLLTLYMSKNSDYIVFRSLPKNEDIDNKINSGVNNLLANCQHNQHYLKYKSLNIFGLKDGRLHDRYILISEKNGLPLSGFHLSNSFQKAAENYPLLVTPIPIDVLYKVLEYKQDLIQEAETVNASTIKRLFRSQGESVQQIQTYEPLQVLDSPLSGYVLSGWLNEPKLSALHGKQLLSQLIELEVIQGNSLNISQMNGLLKCLEAETNFEDYSDKWEILGEILAHTSSEQEELVNLQNKSLFIEFLNAYLQKAFFREQTNEDKELSVIDPLYFRQSLDKFLYSSSNPEHFCHMTKYTCLSWAEYYTIKFLWDLSYKQLIELCEAEANKLQRELQSSDTIRLSLLGQIVSNIAQHTSFDLVTSHQLDALLKCRSGLLKWLGYNVLEAELKKSCSVDYITQKIATLSNSEQIKILGWMINRSSKSDKNSEFYNNLIKALFKLLPKKLSSNSLASLVDSLRGHMKQLCWSEPWLFQDIIHPLLRCERVSYDNACEIWVAELATLLKAHQENNSSLLFSLEREAQTTNISALLLANSETKQQSKSLKVIKNILSEQKRVIQQPLASTSNWSKWDDALKLSLWILTFTECCHFYLKTLDKEENGLLKELSTEARDLMMKRASKDWKRDHAVGKQMYLFLEQIECKISEARLEQSTTL